MAIEEILVAFSQSDAVFSAVVPLQRCLPVTNFLPLNLEVHLHSREGFRDVQKHGAFLKNKEVDKFIIPVIFSPEK